MASGITVKDLDSETLLSRYFLPQQQKWILDTSDELLAEKAVRVGWTYGDGFKRVRECLNTARLNYLFVSKDQPTAFEYVENCNLFLEAYNLTSSVVARDTEEMQVPVWDDEKEKFSPFTESIKVGSIKFDNGSRILSFSSNPNAIRAYGGNVGWDEAAHHPNDRKMWAALQGRAAWGHTISVFSSHNGEDTYFAELCDEAKEPDSEWSYYYCDLPTAIKDGLVEKINQVTGKNFSREEFFERAKRRAKSAHGEENLCERSGAAASMIVRSHLQASVDDYEICRGHLSDFAVPPGHKWMNHCACGIVGQLFGEPARSDEGGPRRRLVEQWIRQAFSDLFDRRKQKGFKRWRIGFDVAASGQGDLASIYIDEKMRNGELILRGLLTLRTEDWQVLKWSLWEFMSNLPGQVLGAGDETGLGKQICWDTEKLYSGLFVGLNFSGQKSGLGVRLMDQFADGMKRIPKRHPDIMADYRALKKTKGSGGKWIITEGKNNFNTYSHCDIAYGGALSSHADEMIQASEAWAVSVGK